MDCYECGGRVSMNARSCPHCGSEEFFPPNPPASREPLIIFQHDENTPLKTKLADYGCTVVLGVIIVCVLWLIALMAN
jgi:hypothetical protein